jgi:hypothetical protein
MPPERSPHAARAGMEAFILHAARYAAGERDRVPTDWSAGYVDGWPDHDCGAEVGRRKDAEGWFDVSDFERAISG